MASAYTTTKNISGALAYTLKLELNEKSHSEGKVTVNYRLSLQSHNGYGFNGYFLGCGIAIGSNSVKGYDSTKDKPNISANSTTVLMNGDLTINQGKNLSVSAYIDMTATGVSYIAGDMSVSGSFSTTIVHKLTVNYYSNCATEMTGMTPLNPVGADKNSLIHTSVYYFDAEYKNGLYNYATFGLIRDGYTPTGYWGTTIDGGKLVNQDDSHTGESLATALGKDISASDQSVNIYAQWELNAFAFVKTNGEWVPHEAFVKSSDSMWKKLAQVMKI